MTSETDDVTSQSQHASIGSPMGVVGKGSGKSADVPLRTESQRNDPCRPSHPETSHVATGRDVRPPACGGGARSPQKDGATAGSAPRHLASDGGRPDVTERNARAPRDTTVRGARCVHDKPKLRTPRYSAATVGKSLRKLIELLEAIPPSMATYEPWKRAYDFTATWLRDCEFLLSDNASAVQRVQRMNGSAAACGDLKASDRTTPEGETGTLAAAHSKNHAANLVSSFDHPTLYDIYCLML